MYSTVDFRVVSIWDCSIKDISQMYSIDFRVVSGWDCSKKDVSQMSNVK